VSFVIFNGKVIGRFDAILSTASGDFRGNLAEEYTGLDLGLVTILF
jgi:hypothetical protein